MKTAEKTLSMGRNDRISPRERILAAAADLFYRHGIRAVGVEAIAEAAETNKMTLYRHFPSKDELVAEYLRCQMEPGRKLWDELAARYPGDPRAQLHGWLEHKAVFVASVEERGCPYANAAVEFPDKHHPARRVIQEYKTAHRHQLLRLCTEAKLADPEMLADELFLLVEGAMVTAQSIGREGLAERFMRMGEAMIKAHTVAEPAQSAAE
jgi:AcrR family transcriptional regulator